MEGVQAARAFPRINNTLLCFLISLMHGNQILGRRFYLRRMKTEKNLLLRYALYNDLKGKWLLPRTAWWQWCLDKKATRNPAELNIIVSHNNTETTRKCGLRGKIADAVARKKLKFSGWVLMRSGHAGLDPASSAVSLKYFAGVRFWVKFRTTA